MAPRLSFAAALSFCGAGHAADSASGGASPAAVGVACQAGAPFLAPPAATAEELPWASVWLGHFSGGRHFENLNGQTFVDWRDDKVCFPSRQTCQAWITSLRRAYHRPEGYWTCLLLR